MRRLFLVLAMMTLVALPADAKPGPPIPREKPGRVPEVTPPAQEATPAKPAPPAVVPPKPQPSPQAPSNPMLGMAVPPENPEGDPQQCLADLMAQGVAFEIPENFEAVPPCKVNNPVVIKSVESPHGAVAFPGSPLMRCGFAKVFMEWTANVAAPLVQGHSGQALASISTGPGFVCRGRNGDNTGKVSEHALGNAMDIAAFVLADKTSIPITAVADPTSKHQKLMKALRVTGCGYFTTVLGPGANAAHEEHFHYDLGIHGKTGNYRICQ